MPLVWFRFKILCFFWLEIDLQYVNAQCVVNSCCINGNRLAASFINSDGFWYHSVVWMEHLREILVYWYPFVIWNTNCPFSLNFVVYISAISEWCIYMRGKMVHLGNDFLFEFYPVRSFTLVSNWSSDCRSKLGCDMQMVSECVYLRVMCVKYQSVVTLYNSV